MTDDIVDWLREYGERNAQYQCCDAADEIGRLRAALQPFAAAAEKADERVREHAVFGLGVLSGSTTSGLGVKFQHLFDARAVLAGEKTDDRR